MLSQGPKKGGIRPAKLIEKHWVQAEAACHNEEWEEALMCYNKILYLQPKMASIYIDRARAYVNLCDYNSAASSFKKAQNLMSESFPIAARNEFASILHATGYNFLTQSYYEQAVPYFDDAIALNSLNADVWLHRVLANVGRNEFVTALKDIDNCIALEPKVVEHLILRAKLKWKLGLRDRGNADINAGLRIDSAHPELVFISTRLASQATDMYDKACAAILARDFEKAIEHLSISLQLNPGDTNCLVKRACCYREVGNLKSALNDVESATTFSNDDNSIVVARQRNLIRNDQALLEMQNKRFEAALSYLNDAIDSEIGLGNTVVDLNFFINRGDCYRALGKYHHAALEDYTRALSSNSSNSNNQTAEIKTRIALVHHAIGLELFNAAKYKEAEEQFSAAIAFAPNIPAIYLHRADAALYQEKQAAALVDLQKAGALDPTNISVQEKLRQFKAIRSPLRAGGRQQLVKKQGVPYSEKRNNTITRYHKSNAVVKSLTRNRLHLGANRYPTVLPK